MKKTTAFVLLLAWVGLSLGLAISSEPVYIKGFQNIQDFKAKLTKLMDLMKANPSWLGAQNPLAALINDESPKLGAIRLGDNATRVEVTKLYRQFDASRKALLTKGLLPTNDLAKKLSEAIKAIEVLNNIKS